MATEESKESEAPAVQCLVIGPIGNKFAEQGSDDRVTWEESIKVLEEIILPACSEFGIAPLRADQMAQPAEIPEQIFVFLRNADLVIADVTDGNPNVMHELGLRHTTGKCTIQLGEYGRLPFDISTIRTIFFVRTPGRYLDARDELKEQIRSCLDGNYHPTSAGRIWQGREVPLLPVGGEREEEPRPEEEEEGIVDLMAEMEQALPQLNRIVTGAGEVIQAMGQRLRRAQAEVEAADSRGQNVAGARLTIAKSLATDLDHSASDLEALVADYERALIATDRGVGAMITAVEHDRTRLGELADFPSSVKVLGGQTREFVKTQDALANQISELGRLSRVLRGPARRIAQALRHMTQASTVIFAWESRLLKLGESGTE